nr:squamosa promoter-binding protein 2-like isoform X2 [Coffea arabica]
MEPHMHHLRQSSSAVHSPFAPTKKVTEEAETDTEEEEEEEEEVEEEEEEEEDGNGGFGAEIEVEPELKKKRMNFDEGPRKRGSRTAAEGAGGGGGAVAVAPPPGCRAENCKADLTDSKSYHKRHKVCEYHAKAEVVVVEGLKQRFCQQCSRINKCQLMGFWLFSASYLPLDNLLLLLSRKFSNLQGPRLGYIVYPDSTTSQNLMRQREVVADA